MGGREQRTPPSKANRHQRPGCPIPPAASSGMSGPEQRQGAPSIRALCGWVGGNNAPTPREATATNFRRHRLTTHLRKAKVQRTFFGRSAPELTNTLPPQREEPPLEPTLHSFLAPRHIPATHRVCRNSQPVSQTRLYPPICIRKRGYTHKKIAPIGAIFVLPVQ